MNRLSIVACAIAISCAAGSFADQVEIVLDASAAMARPGVGGLPISVSVREALAAVVTEAPARQADLRLGLRIAGGDQALISVDSCAATSLVHPLAAVDPMEFSQILDGIGPHGQRPLISTVLRAVADLSEHPGPSRLIVVTSGDDQCLQTPAAVVSALAAQSHPVELRIVGLGLEQAAIDRYGAIPKRNATSAEELLSALRWAILDSEDDHDDSNGELVIRPTGDDDANTSAKIEIVHLASDETRLETFSEETRLTLRPGRHRLRTHRGNGSIFEIRNLLITAGSLTEIGIDLRPAPEPAIAFGWGPVIAGTPIWVDVAGAVPEGAELVFAAGTGQTLSRSWPASEPGSWIAGPSIGGELELQLTVPAQAGARQVLTRTSVRVVPAITVLGAPDDVAGGEPLVVTRTGPDRPQDIIGLTPRDGTIDDLVSCAVNPGNAQLVITTPSHEAELDLIWINGDTLEEVTRVPFRTTGPRASITAQQQVGANQTFEVTWVGPTGDEDFISLAEPDSPDDAYLSWVRIEEGTAAVFVAPAEPGTYEIRYVDGEKTKARARAKIEVTAIAIVLEVPSTAAAGRRIDVHWKGPAKDGDFVAISKTTAPIGRYHDWSSTATGSPTSLAAPRKPGNYEVRYISGSQRRILARTPIKIQP